MALRLNDIVFTDSILTDLADTESKLPRREERAAEAGIPVEERLKRLATAGDTALEVAFKHYALERPTAPIVQLLCRGARSHTQRLELPESRGKTLPWYYVQYVSWATAFSDPDVRQRLSHLPSIESTAEQDNVSLYAHLLTSFLRGEMIDEPLHRLRDQCSDRKAAKFLATTLLPCAVAMRATLDHNPADLNAALGELLVQHAEDVKTEYRTLALRGFMNAPGLFYVRIALERGIPLTIDSHYLPIWLVDLCRTTPPSTS